MKYKISASVMCANLLNIKRDIKLLEDAGVDYLHWDIMDGNFVPNYSMNQDFMKAAREITDLKFDVHLMIERPGRYIEKFAKAGADLIVVHEESTRHLHRVIQQIKKYNLEAGVALNPATSIKNIEYIVDDLDLILIMTVNPGFAGQKLVPSTLKKIESAKKMVEDNKPEIDIQVDGNVSFSNLHKMHSRGANVFVAGSSSIFKKDLEILEGIKKMRDILG